MKTCPPQGLSNISGVTGIIQMYAGLTAPSGYLICDGSAISRTTYSALFNVIGTTYGSGDGTTFNLPDLRNRVPIGTGQSTFTSTFAYTNVDVSTNIITVPRNNSLYTGSVVVLSTTGSVPTGLTANNTYYVIRLTTTTIQLALSLANAVGGAAIDITGQGTGNHTLTVTYSNRTLGEIGGRESSALTLLEMPSHTHTIQGYVRTTYDENDMFSNMQGLDTGTNAYGTSPTGGSQARSIMNPYLTINYIIRY